MGPNYFIFMGNLKIMKRACMPRHARACMFLTLSLYMIMQFPLICLYLPSIHVHVCLSVWLCKNIHVPLCVCVRVCERVCVHVCVCMHACTYVCIGPMCGSFILAVGLGPPSPDKNPGSAHGSARLSIHLSIENCKVIN